MPYKNKCFSFCKKKSYSECGKSKYCKTVRKYNRSGKNIKSYCRLSKKYKLFRGKKRTRSCRPRKI